MRRISLLIGLLVAATSFQIAYSQQNMQGFRMSGNEPELIEINQTFTANAQINPFGDNFNRVFGLAFNGDVAFQNDNIQ